jgi:3-methyladenine DNA glycosylase AlkC
MGTMNELINATVVESLRQQLDAAASVELPETARPTWTETRRAAEGVDGINLRARSDLVSAALIADLPNDYATIARIVRRALDNPAFTGWMMWPVTETVTTAALESDNPDAFDDGLRLLSELTPRLTGEFAIRRFLAADLDRSLETIFPWTAHPNEHVRRLASEGTRAFLPWAIRVRSLLEHPEKVAPILTALRDDESEYVRRSVANHLNDLGRQSPALATRLAGSWLESPGEHTAWVVRHGLRVLIPDPGGCRRGPPPRQYPFLFRAHQHGRHRQQARGRLSRALRQGERRPQRQGVQARRCAAPGGGDDHSLEVPRLPTDDHPGALPRCALPPAADQRRSARSR